MIEDNFPFTIKMIGDVIVVTFAQYVDHKRTHQHERELYNIVEHHKLIIGDLSMSRKINLDWLRFILCLSANATKTGNRFVIFGMRDNVKKTSDLIGILDKFYLCNNLHEVIG